MSPTHGARRYGPAPCTRNAGRPIRSIRKGEHEDVNGWAWVWRRRWRWIRGIRRVVDRLRLRPVAERRDSDDGGMAGLARVERGCCPFWVTDAAAVQLGCGQADSRRARDAHPKLETVDGIARSRLDPRDERGRLRRSGREIHADRTSRCGAPGEEGDAEQHRQEQLAAIRHEAARGFGHLSSLGGDRNRVGLGRRCDGPPVQPPAADQQPDDEARQQHRAEHVHRVDDVRPGRGRRRSARRR